MVPAASCWAPSSRFRKFTVLAPVLVAAEDAVAVLAVASVVDAVEAEVVVAGYPT